MLDWGWPLRTVVLALAVWSAAGRHLQPSDTIEQIMGGYGVNVEEHRIVTADGYILVAFRLSRPNAPVVLFQHGILSSAWCWIENSPDLSPAYQAYLMGYDVWMTNSRGNMFSRGHVVLDSWLNKEYWDFSFADMAREDVPANINYILQETGQKTLTFVAHSQGSTQFFASMTLPETKQFLSEKVNLFVAVAPVTQLKHQAGILLNVLTKFKLGALVNKLFPYGFGNVGTAHKATSLLCRATFGMVCSLGVDVVCGISDHDDRHALTNVSAHFPAGVSVKSLAHFEQLIVGGGFRDYDYGTNGNMQRYNSERPPVFDLRQAAVPTALFIGSKDNLGDPTDEEYSAALFQKNVLVYNETYEDFSHVTWIAGKEKAFNLWFPKFKNLLESHNPLPRKGATTKGGSLEPEPKSAVEVTLPVLI